MPLSAGDRLGPYEIVAAIGRGGMGEVWKARDPRLNRDVAIKVSALQFTDRFEREARAIAALNHPNICTLFDVGPNYLVMEYIEGPTLAERILPGPIPVDEALGIAKQIASALDEAQEKAIVHRDLKPANIKIKADGSVKVLDFGLAKAGEALEVTPDSPTILPETQAGVILGTAGYMSPEQARGEKVDKRADVWAFGVVLFEMVTGKRLFDGATVSDSLAAILTKEPDLMLAPLKTRRLAKVPGERSEEAAPRYHRSGASPRRDRTSGRHPRQTPLDCRRAICALTARRKLNNICAWSGRAAKATPAAWLCRFRGRRPGCSPSWPTTARFSLHPLPPLCRASGSIS